MPAPGTYVWTGGAWRSNAGEPPEPEPWTPAQLGFIARPTGANYVRIEDLSGVGSNLRAAAVHPSAHGKIITLPVGTFELNDFTQGDGNKWMHGLMVNPSTSQYYCRGFVGSGAGTVIQMVPNSSHFTMENGSTQTGNTQQFSQTMIWFYGVNDVEFGNLTVQGVEQPHYYHGIRINGARSRTHHVKFAGAAYGAHNMPPGETYSLGVAGANVVVEDCEFDGRRTTGSAPVSSTVIGVLGCTDAIVRRTHCHDLKSGFGLVQWEGKGLTTEDVWVTRPGTGTSGFNGAHTNHEMGEGPIRHIRPHIDLDGYFGPTDGRSRRHNGKFAHMVFLLGTSAGANPNSYVDTEIIDPVYDSWGGVAGAFAVLLDEVAITASSFPKVIKNGAARTGVIRPKWWLDEPKPFNPATQYWIGANSGDGSLWG